MRTEFERWILSTRKQTQPWSLVERSSDGEGYLDLYTQKQWEGWQAARQAEREAALDSISLVDGWVRLPGTVKETKSELIKRIDIYVSRLRDALEEIRQVASGEKQVAIDDTEGMEWIDKRAIRTLKAPAAKEMKS